MKQPGNPWAEEKIPLIQFREDDYQIIVLKRRDVNELTEMLKKVTGLGTEKLSALGKKARDRILNDFSLEKRKEAFFWIMDENRQDP